MTRIPSGQIIGKAPKWTDQHDPRVQVTAELLRAVIDQHTDCLFKDIRKIEVDGQQLDGPLCTTIPMVQELLPSNPELQENSVEKRTLMNHNKKHTRDWASMVTNQIILNTPHVSTILPGNQFTIPNDEIE